MNKALTYILGIAALIFAILYLDACHRLQSSELTAQAVRSVWEADKAIADTSISKLKASLSKVEIVQAKKDSIHTVNNASQKKVIARLIRKERHNRPDSNSVEPQDTIYLLAGNLVDSLENQIQELKTVDSVKSALYAKQLEIQDKLIQTCDSLIKEIKIPAEPSRLSFGLSAGYGLMSTGGEVRAGVFMGPSLTYRIPLKINIRKLFRRK